VPVFNIRVKGFKVCFQKSSTFLAAYIKKILHIFIKYIYLKNFTAVKNDDNDKYASLRSNFCETIKYIPLYQRNELWVRVVHFLTQGLRVAPKTKFSSKCLQNFAHRCIEEKLINASVVSGTNFHCNFGGRFLFLKELFLKRCLDETLYESFTIQYNTIQYNTI